MTIRVSSKNKEKKAKRKNSVKKKRPNRKKKRYKETDNSRTRLICTFKKLLDHCTTVTHMICKTNFVISKQYFSAIYRRCLKLVELHLS